MKEIKHAALALDNSDSDIIADFVAAHKDAGYSDDAVESARDNAIRLLNDAAEFFGEGADVEYCLSKNILSLDLRIVIEGAHFDPFEDGANAETRYVDNVVTLNLNSEDARIQYKYSNGKNYITIRKPNENSASWLKNPIVWAIVLGIALGFVCQALPDSVRSFIIDDVASPAQTVILDLLAGIMGPVIFLSLTSSIVTLDSINELTDLGVKIIKRFVVIILFVMAVSIAVSGLFFNNFGKGDVNFEASQLIDIVLNIIPTNIVDPFLNNNTAQIVVLGFLMGAALLLLGDASDDLGDMLVNINEWTMSALNIVLAITPAVPFLSLLITIGKGNAVDLLEGWKFIVASYLIFTIVIVVKVIKTYLATGIDLPDFWRTIKPIVMMVFTTGSSSIALKQVYEVCEKDLHIKTEYTSFWVPLCSSMLSLATTVNLIVATFMLAQITGVPMSATLLAALVIVTFELSIASPGTTAAWAIMFSTLGLPTSYVGIFTAYKLLTTNYYAAVLEAYDMLELTESAYKMDAIEE